MTESCTSSQHMSRMSQYDWSEHIEAELSSKLNNTGFSVIINLIYRQLIASPSPICAAYQFCRYLDVDNATQSLFRSHSLALSKVIHIS